MGLTAPSSIAALPRRYSVYSVWRVVTGSQSLATDPTQHVERAIDLRGRVVVDRADAHGPAAILQAETLHHRQGVVVPVPNKDARVRQPLGHLPGCEALQPARHRRHAPREACRVGDAVDGAPVDGAQTGDQPLGQRVLVRAYLPHGARDPGPA